MLSGANNQNLKETTSREGFANDEFYRNFYTLIKKIIIRQINLQNQKIVGIYSEYHSRKGLQYDFAKEYKSIAYDVGYEVDWLRYGVNEYEAKNALIPQYVFYQSGSYKNDDLKKAVLNDFREYYTSVVMDGLGFKPTDQWKCDIKKKTLTVPGKDIPVQIGDESFIDVLRPAKDGKCTYHIPVNKISIW